MEDTRFIYIIISQTGTVLSRILKVITRSDYNHASLSLSSDLEKMYSFGRLHPYNPFRGGFVRESKYFGTFLRFQNTNAMILKVSVSKENYVKLQQRIHTMLKHPQQYHYNLQGLCLALFRIHRKRENYYYCSEFVKEMLQLSQVEGSERLRPITKPIHFLELPHSPIYQGKLKEYVSQR